MSAKTIRILYWILTVWFVAFCFFDAIGGLTHQAQGVKGVTHLGYPVYLMDISGTAKLIGAICLLQTRFVVIKEWAYAGFAISFVCASWSHLASGDGFGTAVFPMVFLAFMFLTYYFWKRYLGVKVTEL